MQAIARQRILTGMRPTGCLHLGHYAGALVLWLDYANRPDYECYFLIADYQALGDNPGDREMIRQAVVDVTIDWLAVGLDPSRSVFLVQSYVPEHAELTQLLSTITPQSWLDRNPTLKSEAARLDEMRQTVGFMNYPMSQVADILLPRAVLVPAGEDQSPHIEFTRRVARRFNLLYDTPVFPEPQITHSETPRLVGTDGQNKMGKSLGNTINLSDASDVVEAKVRRMITDPQRLSITEPGHLERHVPFMYLDAFDDDVAGLAALKQTYTSIGVPEVEIKRRLVDILENLLGPIRERRARLEHDLDYIHDILRDGSRRARAVAQETMELVHVAMGIDSYGH